MTDTDCPMCLRQFAPSSDCWNCADPGAAHEPAQPVLTERDNFRCRYCNGTGYVAGTQCQTCGGSGREPERRAAA